MALIQAFANALSTAQLKSAPRRRLDAIDAVVLTGSSVKPILQLNAFPLALSPQSYVNALSSDNPNGSLAALWAFRQLIDPVPSFSQYYNASASSTESTYRQIAQGASIAGNNPFATQVVLDAQQQISSAKSYSNMDGTVGSWLPVQAVPEDWCSAFNNYSDLTIDLSNAGSANSPYTVLGSGADQLQWNIGQGAAQRSQSLNASSVLNAVQMKYQMVSLVRPWFNAVMFKTRGWILAGQDTGFCSSGDTTDNSGVLPIVPSALILGTEIQIHANTLAAVDQQLINAAQTGGESLALGPFPVLPPTAPATVHVIGWISTLTPLSPTSGG